MSNKTEGSKYKCVVCNDIIHSKHRHDYVVCSCGEVSIDGGSDYVRVGYKKCPPVVFKEELRG